MRKPGWNKRMSLLLAVVMMLSLMPAHPFAPAMADAGEQVVDQAQAREAVLPPIPATEPEPEALQDPPPSAPENEPPAQPQDTTEDDPQAGATGTPEEGQADEDVPPPENPEPEPTPEGGGAGEAGEGEREPAAPEVPPETEQEETDEGRTPEARYRRF